MFKISELNFPLIQEAEALISKIFPYRTLMERLTFFAYKNKSSRLIKILMNCCGVDKIHGFWIALDENDNIVGITGLYSYNIDKSEAVWLAWFCVDPVYRGRGIGRKLLECSIEIAKKYNREYFRLYTSNDKNESAAQSLYEKYGFEIIKKEKRLFHTRLIRQLAFEKKKSI
jgi:ribosomal protein S18 acetylase RimI-like enzyme